MLICKCKLKKATAVAALLGGFELGLNDVLKASTMEEEWVFNSAALLPVREPRSIAGGEGRLWVLDIGGVLEIATSMRRLDVVFSKPKGIAFDGEVLWIADEGAMKLVAIEPGTGRHVRNIPLMVPLEKGFNSLEGTSWDGRYIWTAVSAGFSSSINQIDSRTGEIVRSIYAGCDPRGVAAYGSRIYTLCFNGDNHPMLVVERELSRDEEKTFRSQKVVASIRDRVAKGLFFDGERLMSVDVNRGEVFKIDTSEVVTSPENAGVSMESPELAPELELGNNLGSLGLPLPLCNNKFAILVSGNLVSYDDKLYESEFWYDLVAQYRMLIQLGFSAASIYVVYGDGQDFPSRHSEFNTVNTGVGRITDAASTRKDIESIFDGVNKIMKASEGAYLYVWWMSHGVLVNPIYCGDVKLIIGPKNEVITEVEFRNILDLANAYNMRTVVVTACHSGGLLDNLCVYGERSVILASANCARNSFSREVCQGNRHVEADFDFAEAGALRQVDSCGVGVGSDKDGNQKVSLKEVHDFIQGSGNPSMPEACDPDSIAQNVFPVCPF